MWQEEGTNILYIVKYRGGIRSRNLCMEINAAKPTVLVHPENFDTLLKNIHCMLRFRPLAIYTQTLHLDMNGSAHPGRVRTGIFWNMPVMDWILLCAFAYTKENASTSCPHKVHYINFCYIILV